MKLFKKSDLIIIFVCIFAAFVLLLPGLRRPNKLTALVTLNGETVRELDLSSLSEVQTFIVGNVTVEAEKNRIYIKDSPCKDKVCVNSGKLTKPGDSAACVPEGVAVYIKTNSKSEVDAVAE